MWSWQTQSKIFCGCSAAYGAAPNTQCCPVCMGLPGALPVLNRRVVEDAVRAGSALGCEIARDSRLDRKNYFYPDLPKAYSDLPVSMCRCVSTASVDDLGRGPTCAGKSGLPGSISRRMPAN